MGLGKTLQALATVAFYERTDWPVLIVVPSSVKLAWASEIEKWMPMLPAASLSVVRGRADVAPLGVNGGPRIIIMTYSLFVKDSPAATAVAALAPPMVTFAVFLQENPSRKTNDSFIVHSCVFF